MSSELQLPILHLNELPNLAKLLLSFSGDTKHFLFYAPMGAGKTTLIKELCKALGSVDHFSSPTYSIVNEYNANKTKIYHFDLYRIQTAEELLDIGMEEYLDSNAYCFIEWPNLAEAFVKKDFIKIVIEVDGNNRHIRATKI
jgi:tRNA threonylcarbamoyladenosine biosynthesis protein TsaE